MTLEPLPTSKPAPRQSGFPWGLLIAVVAVVTVYWIYKQDRSPEPGPIDPTVSVESVAEQCTVEYILKFAEGQLALAEEVAEGRVRNRQQYLDRSIAITKKARESAFLPLAELDNERIPEGQWSDEDLATVAEHTRKVAAGIKEVVR